MKKDFSVILSAAQTICGRIGPMPVAGAADRARLCRLRCQTGASLIGAGTLRGADPLLSTGDSSLDRLRVRSCISLSGDFPLRGRRFFSISPLPLVFTGEGQAVNLTSLLSGRAEVFPLSPAGAALDLAAALNELHRRSGGDILIEGGGALNHAALSQGVVDEIHLTIAPRISGDPGAPLFVNGPAPVGDPFAEFTLVDFSSSPDGDIFLVYKKKSFT